MPEGDFTMPEGGFQRPEGEGAGDRFNGEGMEITTVDLADAHITVEFDGGKATGSMEDITVGCSLTITMEGDKAVKAVVAENSFSGFGGFGGQRPDGFGGQRPGGKRENTGDSET